MSGVQVLSDGNPRKGGMDEEEREQCIHDIVSWFERKTKLSGAKESTSDLEGLEKAVGTELPDALRSLLLKQSGDIWFDEFKSLTGDEIATSTESATSIKGWKSSYIPFASDVDGTFLVVDVDSKNEVFEFNEEGKGKQLATSLSQYLEAYRNRLLTGKFDFVDEVGLVERSSRK